LLFLHLGVPLGSVRGTPGYRGTPVGNHWCRALQRIWEDRRWKLVPEAGYPGAKEIPVSIVPSLDDQCIGVRSPEVPGIAVCYTSSQWLYTLPHPQPPLPGSLSSHPVSPVRSAGVKNAWSCTSTTPYAFVG